MEEEKKNKKYLIYLVVGFITLIICLLIFRSCGKSKITIILSGDENIELGINSSFIEPGYKATQVYGEMGENCVEKSRELAPLYEEAAKRLGIHYLDAGRVEGVDMYPYDYMHLSLDAHRNLAKHLAEIIPGLI